ncbi:MAG: outer membrane beta-barrel protein [Gammaproteobacteria bacterium]|nr:outer membrane beta-barrel protein [Gammaproteobacteria bacterium]
MAILRARATRLSVVQAISPLVLVFGVLLVLCAPVLAAQERFTITPFTGWVFGGTANTRDGRLRIKETANYGVNVDIPYRGSHTTNMRFSFSTYDTTVEEKMDLSGVSSDLFDMRVDHYQLGGTKVINEGRIQTYGMGTLGVTHFSPRDSSYSSETRFSMHFGLGMDVMLSKHLGLNLQGRLLLPFNYYSGSLFCGSSGCNLAVSGTSSLMQADITAGLVMRF